MASVQKNLTITERIDLNFILKSIKKTEESGQRVISALFRYRTTFAIMVEGKALLHLSRFAKNLSIVHHDSS